MEPPKSDLVKINPLSSLELHFQARSRIIYNCMYNCIYIYYNIVYIYIYIANQSLILFIVCEPPSIQVSAFTNGLPYHDSSAQKKSDEGPGTSLHERCLRNQHAAGAVSASTGSDGVSLFSMENILVSLIFMVDCG